MQHKAEIGAQILSPIDSLYAVICHNIERNAIPNSRFITNVCMSEKNCIDFER